MKKFLKTATLLIITSLVITTMNNCNKTNPGVVAVENQNDFTELIEKSKAMQEHVLTFKTKMKYYHDNPNLKSGGEKYTAPDVVLELESLINFTFCYTDIECNKKTFVTSEIIMPLDDLEKISDPKLTEVYYNKIIDTIQAQMERVDYENMILLLVDLEQTGADSNGDAIVSVGALIGNEGSISSPTTIESGWYFGFQGGNCEGSNNPYEGVWDAALELQGIIHASLWTAPPPGYVRRYNVLYTESITEPNQAKYRTDNDPEDNFLDYDIFYATNSLINYPINGDTRCVSSNVEIPHYISSYTNVLSTAREDASNEMGITLSYIECIIEGNTNIAEDYIKHYFFINFGETWLVSVGGIEIEDILNY